MTPRKRRIETQVILKKHILLLLVLTSCAKVTIEDCSDSQSLYTLSDFPIGAAIEPGLLLPSTRYYEITQQQFNSITPENIFKPAHLQPAKGVFNWAAADALVDFCENQNKRLHGHTLIWHYNLPEWMYAFEGSSSEWEEIFKNHIQTICRHFRGKVTAWDVINEAFNDDGTLRNTLWKQKIGSSYIEKAFRYAHEADPNALLFYNDYNVALNEIKRKAILDLFIKLKQRGVPIHGIGLQMHVSIIHPENSQIASALKEISEAGFNIHLSEVDVSLNPAGAAISLNDDLLQRQANKLSQIVSLYKSIPARYQYGITFWGVGDADSWIRYFFQRDDYPLLFDDNYDPKPVYCKLTETL